MIFRRKNDRTERRFWTVDKPRSSIPLFLPLFLPLSGKILVRTRDAVDDFRDVSVSVFIYILLLLCLYCPPAILWLYNNFTFFNDLF